MRTAPSPGLLRNLPPRKAPATTAALVSGLLQLLLQSPLRAQDPGFVLSKTDGGQMQGAPVRIQGQGGARKLLFKTGKVTLQVPFSKILGLRGAAPRVDDAVSVHLVGGTELKGDLVGGDPAGEDFHLRSRLLGVLRPATDRLACMIFRAQAPLLGPEAFRLGEGADYDEALFMRAGRGLDVMGGALERFHATRIEFARSGERVARSFDLQRLCGVALRGGVPAEEQGSMQLITRAGDCLRVELVGLDDKGLQLETEFGALRLPLDALAALDWVAAPRQFLSDLEPVRVVEGGSSDEPGAGVLYSWRRDRSVSGGALLRRRSPSDGFLVVGGQTFSKGLGVHAPSALTYKVPAGCKAFHALVGLDDEVAALGVRGAVEIRVRIGARTVFKKELIGGRPPVNLGRIEVEPGQLLSLEVATGKGLFLGDRVDWLQAVFLP